LFWGFSPRTPVPPDIPRWEPGFLTQFVDFGRGDAFVVSVVPFANVGGDFNGRARADVFIVVGIRPRVFGGTAYVEEFEGLLSAVTGGDEAFSSVSDGIQLK
jgi:hypothetical protein